MHITGLAGLGCQRGQLDVHCPWRNSLSPLNYRKISFRRLTSPICAQSRSTDKKLCDYKLTELLISIRHYSMLRFAILTVYFAVSGGLLVKFFDCSFSQHYPELLWLFQVGGGTVTIAFFIYEIVLDDNLRRLWKSVAATVRKKDDVLLSHRQYWKNILVPVATYGIFIGTLVFWLCIAQEHYPCN